MSLSARESIRKEIQRERLCAIRIKLAADPDRAIAKLMRRHFEELREYFECVRIVIKRKKYAKDAKKSASLAAAKHALKEMAREVKRHYSAVREQ